MYKKEEINRIKKIIGSYIVSDGDKTYQFYLAKTDSDELFLIYSSNKVKIEMSITQVEKEFWISKPSVLKQHLVTQITTQQPEESTQPSFTIINLSRINEKEEIDRADIEELFNCKVI